MNAAAPGNDDAAYSEPETLGLLKRRLPGQSVMEELLEVHGDGRQRGPVARMLGVHPLDIDSRPWYWGALGERA